MLSFRLICGGGGCQGAGVPAGGPQQGAANTGPDPDSGAQPARPLGPFQDWRELQAWKGSGSSLYTSASAALPPGAPSAPQQHTPPRKYARVLQFINTPWEAVWHPA